MKRRRKFAESSRSSSSIDQSKGRPDVQQQFPSRTRVAAHHEPSTRGLSARGDIESQSEAFKEWVEHTTTSGQKLFGSHAIKVAVRLTVSGRSEARRTSGVRSRVRNAETKPLPWPGGSWRRSQAR